MATLLDSFNALVTPQAAGELAAAIGVEEPKVAPAMSTSGAVLLAAVNDRAATTEGADELLASLNQDTRLHESVTQLLDEGRGLPILDNLFGVGLAKVAAWIKNNSDVDIAPFLPVAAPLFMRVLQDAVSTQSLDAEGLTTLLKTEEGEFEKGNRELFSEVNAALEMGKNTSERAEKNLARFTLEEWGTLSNVPVLAGYAVMMSSLSGPVGLTKEIDALVAAMAEEGRTHEPDSLVGLVSREFTDPEQINALGANKDNALNLARDACLQAIAILNEKAMTDETIEYKEFVVRVAANVAQAAKEGVFLGLGGKPISAEEKTTLDFIAAALAYSG